MLLNPRGDARRRAPERRLVDRVRRHDATRSASSPRRSPSLTALEQRALADRAPGPISATRRRDLDATSPSSSRKSSPPPRPRSSAPWLESPLEASSPRNRAEAHARGETRPRRHEPANSPSTASRFEVRTRAAKLLIVRPARNEPRRERAGSSSCCSTACRRRGQRRPGAEIGPVPSRARAAEGG